MPNTIRHELGRKAIHVSSAAIPVAYALWLPRRAVLAGLAALLAVALAVEVGRLRSSRGRVWFSRVVGALLREHERDRWSGATWMLGSYLLAALLFPRRPAVAAMLAVALGDAAAAIVGRALAARRVAREGARGVARRRAHEVPYAPPRRKTLAGSAACATATALGALLVAGLTPGASVAAALAAAAAEYPDVFVDDNVRVALAAGGAAWLASALLA